LREPYLPCEISGGLLLETTFSICHAPSIVWIEMSILLKQTTALSESTTKVKGYTALVLLQRPA
jgi:hypothetical protein